MRRIMETEIKKKRKREKRRKSKRERKKRRTLKSKRKGLEETEIGTHREKERST